MLDFIVAVTLTAPDLHAVERAYGRWLEYSVVERGRVEQDLAESWGAPAVAGRRYVVMQPASGDAVYLRFVEQAPVEGYAPLRTHGWNAMQILVKDPDDLAQRLADSPFRIIGRHGSGSTSAEVSALQVIGPAQEFVYLGRFPPANSAPGNAGAQTDVGRVAMVALGGSDMAKLLDFYRSRFALDVAGPAPARVAALNEAYGLPPGHEVLRAILRLSQGGLIEAEAYPAEAVARPQRPGELPPGIAVVSFEITSFAALDVALVRPPRRFTAVPYDDRRAASVRGAAGELIELVEAENGAEVKETAEDLEERED